MLLLINQIISNPVYIFITFLSVFAAFAFIIFLAGFLSGLQHLYKIDENADNLVTYRTRAFWGASLLVVLFFIWESVRAVAGIITSSNEMSYSALYTIAFIWVVYALYRLFFKKKKE